MGHIQRYVRDDGSLSDDRALDGVRVSSEDIFRWARSSQLPGEFFDAMAVRESGRYTNEQDDETRSDGSIYYTSYGLYQLSEEEFASTSGVFGVLTDGETSTQVFAQVMEKRRDVLARAAGVEKEQLSWAILAVAHNQGVGAMRAIVQELGNDWPAIKASGRLGGKFRKGVWTSAYDSDEDGKRQRYGDYVAMRCAGAGNPLPPADEELVAEADTPTVGEEDATEREGDVAIDQNSDGASGVLDFALLFGLLWLSRSM